jgi:hypothetical protein
MVRDDGRVIEVCQAGTGEGGNWPPPRGSVYFDDEAFLSGLTGFIQAGLKAGNPVIAVATRLHRKSFLHSLLARGVDGVAAPTESGRFIGSRSRLHC